MSRLISVAGDWARYSRGRGIDFYATDEEVESVLKECLLPRYAPYLLVGSSSVKEGAKYIQKPFSFEVEQFSELRRRGEWHFFFRSMKITPEMRFSYGEDVSAIMSLSGLVHLQHGSMNGKRWSASSIGIVDKVENTQTHELMLHKEYLEVFYALKKGIRKLLLYPTVKMYSDGRVFKSKSVLMSQRMAEKYRKGEILLLDLPDLEDLSHEELKKSIEGIEPTKVYIIHPDGSRSEYNSHKS